MTYSFWIDIDGELDPEVATVALERFINDEFMPEAVDIDYMAEQGEHIDWYRANGGNTDYDDDEATAGTGQ